jgi:hypothetical protein
MRAPRRRRRAAVWSGPLWSTSIMAAVPPALRASTMAQLGEPGLAAFGVSEDAVDLAGVEEGVAVGAVAGGWVLGVVRR